MVIASDFAKSVHAGHRYGNQPYSVHLEAVVGMANKWYRVYFDPLLPKLYTGVRINKNTITDACWLHDVMEDCGINYSELHAMFGYDVAEIVYACTQPKGRTRKERQNAQYFQGIRDTPGAAFVKICDRLCNMAAGDANKRRMYDKEWNSFIKNIDPEGKYHDMYRSIIAKQ